MRGMMAISGTILLAIYLAALLQYQGSMVATEQLVWFLGAGILGTTLGMLVFDP